MLGRGRGAAARDASTEVSPLQMPLWAPREATPGWNVRISRRARRLSMRVFPGGRVEVVVPPGTGLPAIERFVSRHREWAERRAREFELLAPAGGQCCPEHIELALSGQRWSVEFEPARRATTFEPTDGVLRVRPDDDVWSVLQLMDEHDVNQVPVMDQGNFLGMITRERLLHDIRLRAELGV